MSIFDCPRCGVPMGTEVSGTLRMWRCESCAPTENGAYRVSVVYSRLGDPRMSDNAFERSYTAEDLRRARAAGAKQFAIETVSWLRKHAATRNMSGSLYIDGYSEALTWAADSLALRFDTEPQRAEIIPTDPAEGGSG